MGSNPIARWYHKNTEVIQTSFESMKVDLKNLTGCEKLITVQLSPEVVAGEFEVVYREIGHVASVPGFRPGKAPRQVVALHYKDKAKKEVLERLLTRTLKEVLQDRQIRPIADPEVRNISFSDEKLSYEAYVVTKPDIKLGSYKPIQVPKEILKVDGKDIDAALEKLRESHAKFSPIEDRGLELGDCLIADVDIEVNGQKLESRRDEWIELKGQGMVPEFNKEILGAKAGDQRELVLDLPNDYPRKDLAGKKGLFKIKIKEIKKKGLPLLNDDWAKEVGEYRTLQDLREAVRLDLEEHKKAADQRRIDGEIIEQILNTSKGELPKGLVEKRLKLLLTNAAENLLAQGWKEEEVKSRLEELRSDLKTRAERDVFLSFIIQQIAESESIRVNAEDIQRRLGQIARSNRQPMDKVEEHYRDERALDSLAFQLLQEKVLVFLRNQVELIEKGS